jgi:ABC-type branched-subunit amino acid transport system substrate-binding protein
VIKIGALAPLSGAIAPYGPPIINGAKLAVEQINAAGGVLGEKLDLVVRDTASVPDVGRDAARKLVEIDRVPAIIGAFSSGVTLAVSSVTIPAEVVLVSPVSVSAAISALNDDDYVFCTIVSNDVQGRVLARLARLLNYDTVSVVYIDNAYGKDLADGFVQSYARYGGTVDAAVPYEQDRPSYRSEIEKAIADNPEALLLISYAIDGRKQIVEAIEAGYQGKFLFSSSMTGKEVAPGPGCISADEPGPIEGAFGTAPAGTGFRVEQFEADFTARFGAVNVPPFYYQAYDAAMLVALAIERAGKATGEAIRDNLRAVANPPGEKVYYGEWAKAVSLLKAGKEINYEGVSGSVDFNSKGGVTAKILIWQVKGCQVMPVLSVSG